MYLSKIGGDYVLSIDDLRKLADMQEKLLRISDSNRDINLEKYKDIVKQIDSYYFSNLLSEIEKVVEHNQTLEEELEYLEQISSTYEQVLVEQVKFRDVCELYGDRNIVLSDLSTIDKEYIDNRTSIISGYLINEKNIIDSKEELDLLSGRLRDEEKKYSDLKKRLLGFEDVLRNNFINAEGRYLNDLDLEYVSVLSEYKELGYDFKELLYEPEKVKEILDSVYDEVRDVDDKLKTAELCYDKIINMDSKAILDEIALENIRVKYKLTMMKILELLCRNIDDYDMFLNKRKDLFDLIKYRLDFVKKMGVKVSIDPFGRTKVFDQIKVVEAIEDNSKNIHKVRKEINELNSRLEEMISMRDDYVGEIRNSKDIIIVKEEDISLDIIDSDEEIIDVIVEDNIDNKIDNMDMNSIILSSVDMLDDVIDLDENKVILDNQVISIRDFSSRFNMDIVRQKLTQVIIRVNEMFNSVSNDITEKAIDVVPELAIEELEVNDDTVEEEIADVIVNEKDTDMTSDNEFVNNSEISVFSEDNIDNLSIFNSITDDIFDEKHEIIPMISDNYEFVKEEDVNKQVDIVDSSENVDSVVIQINSNDEMGYDNNIFMNIAPFEEVPLFTDRADDDFVVFDNSDIFVETEDISLGSVNEEMSDINVSEDIDSFDEIQEEIENVNVSIDNIVEDNTNSILDVDIHKDLDEEMPDAFWTVQEENDNLDSDISEKEEEVILSFDEQVALLRNDTEEVVTKNKTRVLKLDNSSDIDNKGV